MDTRYSNQDFDIAQHVATLLTDADRQLAEWTGAKVPAYGYSKENFDLAMTCFKRLSGPADSAAVLREAQNQRAELGIGFPA